MKCGVRALKYLVTGGAGFIGSTFIKSLIANTKCQILNIDKLTYAGNVDTLKEVSASQRYQFEKVDICDVDQLKILLRKFKPDVVVNFAAESHVDKSIESPASFLQTNIIGTYSLLEAVREYLGDFQEASSSPFKFYHISTDEVFGDLEAEAPPFTEESQIRPSSPYSASKASSDHLVRSWGRTYGIPYVISNCSNNYGPYHHPEKLIPKIIIHALLGKRIPIFGNGQQIRDWLYVEDHVSAIKMIAESSNLNETYNIGGTEEHSNMSIVEKIFQILNALGAEKPSGITDFSELIVYVEDRAGHDKRYAIDSSKLRKNLNWKPNETIDSGLLKTVDWYINNRDWWGPMIKT